jgi:hypothetical protein
MSYQIPSDPQITSMVLYYLVVAQHDKQLLATCARWMFFDPKRRRSLTVGQRAPLPRTNSPHAHILRWCHIEGLWRSFHRVGGVHRGAERHTALRHSSSDTQQQ